MVTDTGATGIDERTRLARLREEEASYLFYRFVWSELQTQLLRLLPEDSHPVEGRFNRDEAGHTWEESSAPEEERGGAEANPKRN